ncbi:MAG: hypothetical protein QM817_02230 [Archangium sp.]
MRVAFLVALASQLAIADAPAPPDAPLSDRGNRLRLGVSALAGYAAPLRFFAAGGQLRLGWQVSRAFNVHLEATVLGLFPGNFLALGGVAPEITFNDHFSASAAVLLGFGHVYGNVDNPELSVGDVYETPVFKWGFDARVSWSSGRSVPPAFNRPSFSVALSLIVLGNPQITFYDPLLLPDGPRKREDFFTLLPMLSIGFDLR